MLFRKLRFMVMRLYEARAATALKAGRAEDAARLAKKAEEIFRRLDGGDQPCAERDAAGPEVPRA